MNIFETICKRIVQNGDNKKKDKANTEKLDKHE